MSEYIRLKSSDILNILELTRCSIAMTSLTEELVSMGENHLSRKTNKKNPSIAVDKSAFPLINNIHLCIRMIDMMGRIAMANNSRQGIKVVDLATRLRKDIDALAGRLINELTSNRAEFVLGLPEPEIIRKDTINKAIERIKAKKALEISKPNNANVVSFDKFKKKRKPSLPRKDR